VNEDLHKLDYARPPTPADGPTAWHHVLDAIALSIHAFNASLVGYGVIWGLGHGAGGAICLMVLSIPILVVVILLRGMDRTSRTFFFYFNVTILSILILLFLGLLFEALL
jgi:hypothetical protein